MTIFVEQLEILGGGSKLGEMPKINAVLLEENLNDLEEYLDASVISVLPGQVPDPQGAVYLFVIVLRSNDEDGKA